LSEKWQTFGIVLVAILWLCSLQIQPALAEPVYHLNVKKGDWVEYWVADVVDITFYGEPLTKGDSIKFVVSSIQETLQEAKYPNGEVAFKEERAMYDVYLNKKIIKQDVIYFRYVGVLPGGHEYWVSVRNLLQEQEPNYLYVVDLVIDEDIPLLSLFSPPTVTYTLQSSKEVGSEYDYRLILTFSKNTGVLLEYEEFYTDQAQTHKELKFKIIGTNIPGVFVAWYIQHWYVFALVFSSVVVASLVYVRKVRAPKRPAAVPSSLKSKVAIDEAIEKIEELLENLDERFVEGKINETIYLQLRREHEQKLEELQKEKTRIASLLEEA